MNINLITGFKYYILSSRI